MIAHLWLVTFWDRALQRGWRAQVQARMRTQRWPGYRRSQVPGWNCKQLCWNLFPFHLIMCSVLVGSGSSTGPGSAGPRSASTMPCSTFIITWSRSKSCSFSVIPTSVTEAEEELMEDGVPGCCRRRTWEQIWNAVFQCQRKLPGPRWGWPGSWGWGRRRVESVEGSLSQTGRTSWKWYFQNLQIWVMPVIKKY